MRIQRGRIPRSAVTSETPESELDRLHIVVRADVTTRNQRKADRLSFAYDDLEARIAALAEQEELQAMRPDLDGEAIMKVLGIGPGREVGEAYRFLLECASMREKSEKKRLRSDSWSGGLSDSAVAILQRLPLDCGGCLVFDRAPALIPPVAEIL